MKTLMKLYEEIASVDHKNVPMEYIPEEFREVDEKVLFELNPEQIQVVVVMMRRRKRIRQIKEAMANMTLHRLKYEDELKRLAYEVEFLQRMLTFTIIQDHLDAVTKKLVVLETWEVVEREDHLDPDVIIIVPTPPFPDSSCN